MKVRRETVVLGVAGLAAVAITGYAWTLRMVPQPPSPQVWTGHLVSTSNDAPQVAPMSSASLVVPKAQLTLPPLPPKPAIRVKNSCDSADKYCVVRPLAVTAIPPKKQAALIAPQSVLLPPATIPGSTSVDRTVADPAPQKKGFLATINPLNHLPDASTIGRPFAAAGNAVGGWIKRF